MSAIQCIAIKTDGVKCTKPGIEVFEEKHYCKVHFKSVQEENEPACEGLKKDGSACDKKVVTIFEDKHYCKVHFNQQFRKADEKMCEELKKDGSGCGKKAIGEFEEKHYCKVHLNQHVRKSNEKMCEGLKKDGSSCDKKAAEVFEQKHYCRVHFKSVQKDNEKQLSSNPDIKDYNKFLKDVIRPTYSESQFKKVKDEYKRLVLIFHPDKCKIKNIDASEYTKRLNSHMDKVKVKP